LRAESPRVHIVAGSAGQSFMANLLLAAGAVPSMTMAPDEVAELALRSDALLVNFGIADMAMRQAVPAAVMAAQRTGRPWCLDPAMVDRSEPRLMLALDLMARRPAIVRCTGAEFAALEGNLADEASIRAAASYGTVVAVSGDVDTVSDGARLVRVANGHPLMQRIMGIGGAGTALAAAFAAIEPDALAAAVAAVALLGMAGEMAAERAAHPGSFTVALVDALDAIDDLTIHRRLRIHM
jgi:hydroxyethylthiazole kinase